MSADADVIGHLRRIGLLSDTAEAQVTVLSGGVSNDVVAVRAPGLDVVVKRALPQLRVAEEWFAAPERINAEAKALHVAGGVLPALVPRVLDLDEDAHIAVIERAPDDFVEWRPKLLAGKIDATVATELGKALSQWHSATSATETSMADFGALDAFVQLRIDPFYRHTAGRHPDLAERVHWAADRLLDTQQCLVHGDFSPKNILVGSDGLWVIDWEVAHIGDPVFDQAFLVHHLLCKAVHRPYDAPAYQNAAEAFLDGYASPSTDEEYLVTQIACLTLARVDGKSPVGYLTESQRATTRSIARALLSDPNPSWSTLWKLVL